MYEYYLDRKKEVWVPWKLLVEPYVHDPEKKFSDILVPTEDSTRINWLLTLMNEVLMTHIEVSFREVGSFSR